MAFEQAIESRRSGFAGAFHDRSATRVEELSWLARMRETAIERFEQLGYPTVRDEEWKYTSLAAIAKTDFAVAGGRTVEPAEIEPHLYPEARETALVFVNGEFDEALSSLKNLPDGVAVLNLAEAANHPLYAAVIREHLARGNDVNEKPFNALNTAFLGDGAFVFVPQGTVVAAPIQLHFHTAPDESALAVFPRLLVVCETSSEATIIESHTGGDGVYLSDSVVEIVLTDDAKLTHYLVQNEGPAAFHLVSTIATLGRNSAYDATTVTLGAQLARHDILVNLNGEGAECWVDGLYVVGDGQHADTHSAIHHLQPHGTSHQIYKGILDGRSRAVFNGKVFVHVDAQQTDARQTNRNLLLSNEARVDTKPQLEIFADDVKCAHGATVGQLEEEELFYLISRGLHPELARNLLTYGFAEEVIQKIKIESIKAQLDEAVLHRLHARLDV
jgi:Fe-S cluster assembly protein SufD